MPIFKNYDKSNPSNYRPISLLSCVGKVMERVVYKYIYNHIIDNSLLYQSGFLHGHSLVYQLIEIYEKVYNNLDNRISNILFFCDISKALDRVWHRGLVEKLMSYGISGPLLDWTIYYVTNRKQFVMVNEAMSSVGSVTAGVPQG
jgi:hypothetical protein